MWRLKEDEFPKGEKTNQAKIIYIVSKMREEQVKM